MAPARARHDQLTKPAGSLGRLEELAISIAGMTGSSAPRIESKAVIVMAGDHGVVADGVSLYPQDVTPQMVMNFLSGGAAINVLARLVDARVVVVDMGVAGTPDSVPGLISRKIAPGTDNMARGPAMSRQQAIDAIEAGIEILETEEQQGLDIVATGDMGIGNTTASSAICAAITGASVEDITGPGTGLDAERVGAKAAVIRRALDVNHPDPGDGLDVLSKVGGFEIGGLAGVILGAAAHRTPVVLDGFISGAAALVAASLCPAAREYMKAGHRSPEPGHAAVLEHLKLSPYLDLGMRLGEGTGAALGIFLAETAVDILAGMATFGEAGVSGPDA
jgi:nicotinate-nucleotide--dimethylbenzimidazole phosphoribosyltransferase